MKLSKIFSKLVAYLYYSLFFVVPLIFFHKTSELFEFNKMVATYIFTILIASVWMLKMIGEKRVIFRHTKLDLPIVAFVVSQTLSTVLSIDQRTSFLGYYSRFNGGLLSTLCYAVLYWGLVSNLNFEETKKLIKVMFVSLLISSIWAILEHFGHSLSCLLFPEYNTFDVSCWVQDVQFRVYSTFGQPNWLASYLCAVIPLTWALFLQPFAKTQGSFFANLRRWAMLGLSTIFTLTLLYTKSRSGIVSFLAADFVFWPAVLILSSRLKTKFIDSLKIVFLWHIVLLTIFSLVGTPWTPNLKTFLSPSSNKQPTESSGPALEVGGTSSSAIRKIVWKGAINIWKNYPIFGTGVETFAFSYYNFRPAEHNLTSEWDYLYNKAHNEYLNYAATTGTVGLLSYLVLILFTILVFVKSFLPKDESKPQAGIYALSLLAGYLTILITNFFGFSVVPVALQFFLFPAIAVNLTHPQDHENEVQNIKFSGGQISALLIIMFTGAYLIVLSCRYWYADYLFANGKAQSDAGNWAMSLDYLNKAVAISPKEPSFWEQLANTSADVAVGLSQQGNKDLAENYMNQSISAIKIAINLSPANVNLKRSAANIYINLSMIEPSLIIGTRDELIEAVKQAPTDAKLFYNLGLSYLRTGENDSAEATLEKTIELKPDYRNAHYALGLLYTDMGKKDMARQQYEYVLKNIDPNDADVKRELNDLKP